MARSGFRAGDRARAKEMFRKLPREVRKATAVALDSAAEELTRSIRNRVPIDDGDLRDSVKWRRGSIKGGRKEADLAVTVSEGDRKAFYAPFVEHGTQTAPAQPHFWPTWRASKRRLIGRIRRAQAKAIREAAKNV